MKCYHQFLIDINNMHKLEFCLLALGCMNEDAHPELSEKLIRLSSTSHNYIPPDIKECDVDGSLYLELFNKFQKFKKPK